MVQYGGPDHPASAGPLAPSRLPLSPPPVTPHLPAGWSLPRDAGPRPWGTRFAVPPVIENKHHKRPTHGVRTKTTKYIDDGKEHTDTVNEPYEDEEDE